MRLGAESTNMDRDQSNSKSVSDVTAAVQSAEREGVVGAIRSFSFSPRERSIDQLCIDTIRTLSIDAVQQANSGHPGTPMALAPVVYTIWQDFLRFDPNDPIWPNRDRFVLSAGHASMLLYAMLHLTGVKAVNAKYENLGKPSVTLDDIKRFRQLGSKCPGHPEYRLTSGVETTTGPLGQGCGNSVGMALAGRWLAQHFNRPGFTMFDYDVYVICGDGDMMEGVSSEAASLAGHQMLGNLCWIYDSNRVTIEGHTDLAFSDDVAARFLAYGWNVLRVGDANDTERLAQALKRFQNTQDLPTLIIVESHIGYGAPHKHDTSAAHGEPLGEQEIRLTKRRYGWPEDAKFLVPDGVMEHFRDRIGRRGRQLRDDWFSLLKSYWSVHPDLADQIERMSKRELPDGWDADLPIFPPDPKGLASRDSSGKVLNAIARHYPWLIGGSADLAPSTKTRLTFEGAGDMESDNPGGRNLHFGIREHAMGAVLNGLALSKIRAYGSGFLIFSDYMKPPIRLSALMEIPVIYIFTHDFDRRRPRWPHPPADRAAYRAALHTGSPDAPSRRRKRSDRGLARHHRTSTPTGLPHTNPAAAADVRSQALCACVWRQPRRLHSRGWHVGKAQGYSDRDRQRGGPLPRRLREARTRGNFRTRRQHAFVGAVRATRPVVP